MPDIIIRLPEHADDSQIENIEQMIYDALNDQEVEDDDGNTVTMEFPAHKEGAHILVMTFPEKEEEEDE